MKVFISWSGTKSRDVALALREWLPSVMNSVEPFVSAKDIYAGTRWQLEISAQLEATNFGIVCVTKENQQSPWLNFEAGALAKAVEASRVVPLAIDLKPSDIELPLGQFQAQSADLAGVTEICRAINGAMPQMLDTNLLSRAITKWWPDLESDLEKVEAKSSPRKGTRTRSERELLEEVLNTVRSLARNPSRGGPVDSGRLTRSHPLMDEIEDILKSGAGEYEIMFDNDRLVVACSDLDPTIRDEIVRRSDLYGVRIDFLPSRMGRPSPIRVIEDTDEPEPGPRT